MQSLLFLAHRVPYPPNKGDKIRSFHLLKELTKHYQVYLGAFVDDINDFKHANVLRDLCADICLVGIKSWQRKLKSLSALFTGEALSQPYYRHATMRRWVQRVLHDNSITHVLIYSSPMAQYVLNPGTNGLRRIADLVDVDSEKWREYSQRQRWPLSWVYAREARKLLAFERRIATSFDATVFVSEEEASLFRHLVPESAERITSYYNGVDVEFFSPEADYPNPYKQGEKVIVFTGAMDYWANVDAVSWFAKNIFPQVRKQIPTACFYIVGARPTNAVHRLEETEGVYVTGAVIDIRPYLAHATAAVAPLRIARGIQNKVLEAFAMAKPVIATPAAMIGIRDAESFSDIVTDNTTGLASRAVELLRDGDKHGLGQLGRDIVTRHYTWIHNLEPIRHLLRADKTD